MLALLIVASAGIGAGLYRLRGGLWRDLWARETWWTGTQAMRALWAIPTAALMVWASGGPLWLLAPLAVSNFAGLALFGNGQYLADVPLRRAPDWLGLARNALAAIPVVAFSPVLFGAYAASGMTHAALYWLGFRAGGNSTHGEMIVGAVSWAIIVIVGAG